MHEVPVHPEVRRCLRDLTAVIVRRDRQKKQKRRKRAATKAVKAVTTEEPLPEEPLPLAALQLIEPKEKIARRDRMIELLEKDLRLTAECHREQVRALMAEHKAPRMAHEMKEKLCVRLADMVPPLRAACEVKDERIAQLERELSCARYGSALNEYGDTGKRKGGGRQRDWRKWFAQQTDELLRDFGRHLKHVFSID